MKFLHIFAAVLFASLFAVLSCSSGSSIYYNGGGVRCPDGYDPMPIDPQTQGFKPMSVDPKVASAPLANANFMPGGSYTMDGIEIFYNDTTDGIQVHTHLVANADGGATSSPVVVCNRNLAQYRLQTTKAFALSMPALRTITTDNKGHIASFQYENVGYVFDIQKTPVMKAVNCDVNTDPNAAGDPNANPPVKPDPARCGVLPQAKSLAVSSYPTVDSLYPIVNPATDKLVIYCYALDDACENPGKARLYQIRYTKARTPDKPGDHAYNVEVVSTMIWYPPVPGAAAPALPPPPKPLPTPKPGTPKKP